MALAVSLLDPLCPSTKANIAKAFWPPAQTQHQFDDRCLSDAYWQYYQKECERALHDGGRHVLARTHQDLVDIVLLLQDGQTRDSIHETLRLKLNKKHDNEEELVSRAIDLAASLLLMIDCTNIEYGFNGSRQLEWTQGSIQHCVSTHFRQRPTLGHEGVKLPRMFNARALESIAGIQILPTANLLDHLRLAEDDTKLYVFHHASYLKFQSKNDTTPEGVIEETLRTIALLFPQSDVAVRKWYRQLPSPFTLDSQLILCGHLKTDDRQIEKFVYWRDRLVVLKQVFDEATPQNLSQWWHDRRNGVQWYTFWVAILVLSLTLFFGFIQSIEGALQVYASFQGNH